MAHILRDSQLCNPCTSLPAGERHFMAARDRLPDGGFDWSKDHVAPYILGQNLPGLEQAARAGCHLCFMRWRTLSSTDRAELEGCRVCFGYSIFRRRPSFVFQYFYPVPKPGTGPHSRFLMRNLHALPSEEALPYFRHGTVDNVSNDCQENLAIASERFRACCGHHTQCNVPSSNPGLPTRLIVVGGDDTIQPRLCLSKDLPSNTQYMTLSHCWGHLKILTLTRDSLESMQVAIPFEELSRTFQDAIRIVRHLGYQYLWIDSLCIIQGDEADWLREAPQMASIYSNSICNITAASAADGSYGCFTRRDPRCVAPCQYQSHWDDPTENAHFTFHDIGLWNREITSSTISSRAWVVQETVFARRTLFFGQSQMFWQCSHLQACEAFSGGIPRSRTRKPSISSDSIGRSSMFYVSEVPSIALHQVWDELVSDYTKADLKYLERDKLMALAGLASAIDIKEDYLAGLWKGQLPRQLLWSSRRHSTRNGKYQAPTWSWASLNVPINPSISIRNMRMVARIARHRNAEHRDAGSTLIRLDWILISIVEANVKLKQPDVKYGPVEDGRIRLQGPMFKARALAVSRHIPRRVNVGGTHCTTHIDTFEGWGDPTQVPILCYLAVQLVKDEGNPSIYGLVLETTGKSRGEYIRRGSFEAANSMSDAGIDPMLDHLRKSVVDSGFSEEEYEAITYVDEHGFQTYQISII